MYSKKVIPSKIHQGMLFSMIPPEFSKDFFEGLFFIYIFSKDYGDCTKIPPRFFSGLLARVLPVIHPTIFSGSLFEKFRQNYFLGFISGILKKIVSMHPFQMQFRNSSKNFSILSFFSPGNSYMDFFFRKFYRNFLQSYWKNSR